MEVVDGHARLRTDAEAPHRLLAEMDALGVTRALVAGGGYITPDQLARHIAEGGGVDVDVDHELLLRQCEADAARLLPAYIPNPYRGEQACRLYRDEGHLFKVVKIVPVIHGIGLHDPRVIGLIEIAEEFGHPVSLHCMHRPGFTVGELVLLALRFPRVSFILEHAGVGNCDFHGLSLIREHANISFETSGGFALLVKEACKRLGPQRVIFGSEYPIQNIRPELVKMECLGLEPADMARVMGGNLMNLMQGAAVHGRAA